MTICRFCNKEIEIIHRLDAKKVFCNRSCSSSYNNKLRIITDDQKQKARNTLFSTLARKGWVKKEPTKKRELLSTPKPCIRCESLTKNAHGICRDCSRKPHACKRCGIWSSSEYCLNCIRLNAKEETIRTIEIGEYKSNNIRSLKRYLIETRGHQCEICKQTEWMGQPIPLVMDHINGRSSENNLENLRLVCGNCDMQLPTYKSKNKNSDRKSRKGIY